MVVVQLTILTALYDHLTADSDFNTAIGGSSGTAGRLWWDKTDQDQTFPYVVMTVIASSQIMDCMPREGYDYTVQFTAYDDPRAGAANVVDIIDKLRARLDRTRFTVSNHDQMPGQENTTRGPFMELDGQAWRMDADYLIRGSDNS